MTRIYCPQCGKRLRPPAQTAVFGLRCPSCSHIFGPESLAEGMNWRVGYGYFLLVRGRRDSGEREVAKRIHQMVASWGELGNLPSPSAVLARQYAAGDNCTVLFVTESRQQAQRIMEAGLWQALNTIAPVTLERAYPEKIRDWDQRMGSQLLPPRFFPAAPPATHDTALAADREPPPDEQPGPQEPAPAASDSSVPSDQANEQAPPPADEQPGPQEPAPTAGDSSAPPDQADQQPPPAVAERIVRSTVVPPGWGEPAAPAVTPFPPDVSARRAMGWPAACWRFKWTFLGVFLLVSVPALAAIWMLISPLYQAEGTFRIILPRTNYANKAQAAWFLRSHLSGQIAILASPTVMRRTVSRPAVRQTAWHAGRKKRLPAILVGRPQPPAERLGMMLSAVPEGDSDAVNVTFRAGDPRDATVILSAVLDEYARFAQERVDPGDAAQYRQLSADCGDLRKQIRRKEQDLTSLRYGLGAGSAEELAARKRIRLDQAEARLSAARRELAVLQWEQRELSGKDRRTVDELKRREKQLAKDCDTQRAEWERAFQAAERLAKGTAELDRKKKDYADMLARLDRMEAEHPVPSSMRLLSQPSAGAEPVGDPRVLLTVLSLVGGLLGGVGAAWGRKGTDQTIHVAADLPHDHRMCLLGILPLLPRWRRRRPENNPRLAESVRTLRTSLLAHIGAGAGRIVLITSAGPKAGKTTLAVMLAESLANSGKRVLLVDADLRRPAVAARMQIDGQGDRRGGHP